uniref:T9SS type A sorting domain-containing protein n=1 Tax=Flavobacterium sp. TaxID=239 RepID=UPI0026098CE6
WIVKLNKDGVIEWQKTVGGDKDDKLAVLTQTRDGGFIAGGNSNSGLSNTKNKSNANGTDFWILKFDREGSIVWQETYDYGDIDALTSIVENPDGTFLIAGHAQNGPSNDPKVSLGKKSAKKDKGINDYIALKINAKGEEIWTQTTGSAGDDVLKKLIETRDGGYLLAGTSNPQSIDYSSNPADHSKTKGGGMLGNTMQNLENNINEANPVNGIAKDINSTIKDKSESATKEVNDAISEAIPDSRFKMGVNAPTGGLGVPTMGVGSSGDALGELLGGNNQKKLPPSEDKKNNLGYSDFWVVKLKDKGKKEKTKVTIEVLPNPVVTFTNVIINYEYTDGTGTLYDLNGRLLDQIKLNGERTVPFDMSRYPRGIYIININTNVEQTGIKVIKE